MTAHSGGSMTLVESSAPPQPHLQHYDVAPGPGKIEQAQGGNQLELGGHVGHGRGGRLHLLHQIHQVLVGDGRAVHLDPLIEPEDIGRGEQPHLIACLTQAAVQHGGGAALAVGARHVHKAQVFLGIAQQAAEGADALQAGTVALPVDRVDVVQSFLIGHCERLPVWLPRAAAIRAWFSSRMRTSTNSAPARISALGMRAASTAQA